MGSPSLHKDDSPGGHDHDTIEDEPRLDESEATIEVHDSQNHEYHSGHDVPTNALDGEVVIETQIGHDRPGSDGTATGVVLDAEAADVLAKFTTAPRQEDVGAITDGNMSTQHGLLSRPEGPGELHADTGFAFANANRQQLDLTGARKRPYSAMAAAIDQIGSTANEETSCDGHILDNAVCEHNDALLISATQRGSPDVNDDDVVLAQHAASHSEVPLMDKKRKKKKRRYGTTPTEPIQDSTPVGSAKPESSGLMQSEGVDKHDATKLCDEVVQEPQLGYRSHKIVYASDAHHLEGHPSSPLLDDLEGTTREPLRSPNARSPPQHACQGKLNSEGPPIEPISPVRHDQDVTHSAHRGGPDNNLVDHAHYRIVDPPVTTRVSKTKSKASRWAKVPTSSQDQSLSDLNDYVQIFAYKIRQHKKTTSAKFAAERKLLEEDLQRALEAKQALEAELTEALHEKESLAASLDKQKLKVKAYESNINRFKTFVDGIGKDFDTLKKDSNAARRKGEQLTQDGEDCKAERVALFNQLNICAERSAQLKDQALKVCQETQLELKAAMLQSNYLDQQLSEKVGLLAEERDRRSQLEKQLASAAALDQSALRKSKAVNDAILDKLYEIHAALDQNRDSEKTSDILEKTLAAVQAVNSHTTATVDDIISIKALIETLSESLTDRLDQSAATHEYGETLASTFQTHLENALRGLKADLSNRETLIQQDAAHREAVTCLQDKLKTCHVRIVDYDSQISAAREKERQLQEQNANLQAKITALQSEFPSTDNACALLSEAKAELNLRIKALESTNVDLASKSEEVRTLRTANTTLQGQTQSLQDQLEEVKNSLADLALQREHLEHNAQTDVERVRKEMLEHTERFQMEVQANASNDVKKLSSERHRLEKQLKALTGEFNECKAQLQELQRGRSTGKANREQEISRLPDLVQSQSQEIASLQASLNDVRNALKGSASVKEENSALAAQLSSEKTKLKRTLGEKSALLDQVQDFQRSSTAAQHSWEQLRSDFEEYRTDKEKALKALEEELAKAKDAAERSEVGLEHFKGTCKKAVHDENKKTERQAQALNERLSELEVELENNKHADEEFRAEVERSWQHEQKAFEDRSNVINRKIADGETQRDEAMADNKRLRQELQNAIDEQRNALLEQLNEAQHRANSAEQELKPRQGPSGNNLNMSSRLRVPSLSEDITPTASIDSTAPIKPRKKVDRNNNATVDVEPVPVPVPDELSLESRRTGSAMSNKSSRDPVVEESQFISDPFAEHSYPEPEPNPFTIPFDSDGELHIDQTELQPHRETVDETQFEQRLPSFSAFNDSMATSDHLPSKVASSAYLVPSLHESQSYSARDINQRAHAKRPSAYVSSKAQQPSEDFGIYEDSQETTRSPGLGDLRARRHSQDSLSLSQAEKDKYTFQKTFPKQNSASKIVHPSRKSSNNLRRKDSMSHRSAQSISRGLETSGVRGEGSYTPAGSARSSGAGRLASAHSSTPDFVHGTNDRKMSTYLSPGGSSGKRGLSRTHSVPATDPRLVGRDPPQASKRKPEGQIVEGYEHERKKRVNPGSRQSEPSRFSLRSRAQPSIIDLPRLPTMPVGPATSRRSSATSTAQSRMRTLAGGSSRTTRSLKKLSKNDEFNARFSQELDSR